MRRDVISRLRHYRHWPVQRAKSSLKRDGYNYLSARLKIVIFPPISSGRLKKEKIKDNHLSARLKIAKKRLKRFRARPPRGARLPV